MTRQLTDLPNFKQKLIPLKQLDATPTLQLVVKCWYPTSWTNELLDTATEQQFWNNKLLVRDVSVTVALKFR